MVDPETLGLLAIVIVLLIVVVLLTYHRRGNAPVEPEAIQQAVSTSLAQSGELLRNAVIAGVASSGDALKGVMSESLRELGVHTELGSIRTTAEQMLSTSRSLQSIFEVKHARAAYGELLLEDQLKDVFPPGQVHIRENLPGLGTPDAYIKSPQGIVCIDSKFPLENYRAMVESADEAEKSRLAAGFRKDVQVHIAKVAEYVRPEVGTAPVAFMFIPSEAVFVHLAEKEPDVLVDAARRNVIVVSPSTLLPNVTLILGAIKAQEIAEKAEQIQRNLTKLEQGFDSFEKDWDVLQRHLQNAHAKMGETDQDYQKLRTKFDSIASLQEEPEEPSA